MSDKSRKVFISKTAVKAIEARVANYFKMYPKALDAAKMIIDSEEYQIVPADNFIKSWAADRNSNSIFELAFSATDNISINGLAYIYRFSGSSGKGYGDISVTENLYTIYEDSDVRKDVIGEVPGNPGYIQNLKKYPDMNGYDNVVVIRYEEMVLIYAEALLNTNPGEALTWLNKIPENRGATPYTVATLDNVILERRKELAFEGFRFDDLVRTGRGIPKVEFDQNIEASIPAGDYRLAYPIPKTELDANSNMVQNEGY